jgi:hypothetical protein
MQDFDSVDDETSFEKNLPESEIPTLEELIRLAPPEYIDWMPFKTEGGQIKYLILTEKVGKIAA